MKRYIFICIVLISACKESYVPPTSATNLSLLVVEGFINNGPDTTYISLTHTFNLGVDDTTSPMPELHALVQVEGKDNSTYSLIELGNGTYVAPGLALNNAIQYRLHIKTTAGKDYLSDYVDMKPSPPIDSVNFKNVSGGEQFGISTHDPQNASHYYRWEYAETWEFNSVYFSRYAYANHKIMPRNPNTIYTCWKSDNSTDIFLGSSASLAQDLIYEAPLVTIPQNSWEISVEYSINVRQYVLTADAYAFWQNLQKNTEQIGSIFSPQPSTAVGNIHNSQDSTEQVVGYISGGTMQQKRIFVTPSQINNWEIENYPNDCMLEGTSSDPDSLSFYLASGENIPIDSTSPGVSPPTSYSFAPRGCVDCTTLGTNVKPYFWQ